jgi:hypothetical protein
MEDENCGIFKKPSSLELLEKCRHTVKAATKENP